MSKKWSREVVLDKLRSRRDTGKSLCYIQIGKDDVLLRYNLKKLRGGWAGAVSAIGEDPDQWRHYRVWNKLAVLDAIRNRANRGTLKFRQVYEEDSSLIRGARRFFGTWCEAIEAAGLNPRNYSSHHRKRFWSPDAVREAINARLAAGHSMSASALHCSDGGLYRAGVLFFGSWNRALDPHSNPIRKPVTRITIDDIIATIRTRHAQGLPICQAKMEPRNFVVLGNMRLGCWSEVLRAAGFNPENINLHKRWSSEKVTSVIKLRVDSKMPCNSASIRRGPHADPNLYDACLHYFGSWDKGLIAAGINPVTVRLRRRWSQNKVIEEIRRMSMAGDSFRNMGRAGDRQSLIQAAARHFGSWAAATQIAGIRSPSSHQQRWTRSLIISTIRVQEEKGLSFAMLPPSLERAANRLFGSWKAALSVALGHRALALTSSPKPRGGR